MKKEEGEESGKGDKYGVEEEGKTRKNVERGSGERNEGGGGSSKRKEE